MDQPILTYIKTPLHHYTFKPQPIFEWVLSQIKGEHYLNLFAGETELGMSEWRNDMNPDMKNLDSTMEAFEFVKWYDEAIKLGVPGFEKFDTVILDPPYAYRKSMEFYGGRKNSKFKLVKDLLPNIVEDHGRVITFGYHSVSMGINRGFSLHEVAIFNHGGAMHDTIACVEIKTRL